MPAPDQSPTHRSSLRFSVDERDQVAVLAVAGDLDLSSAPQLKDKLTEVLQDGSKRLVLDLDGVPFMDSTALSVVIAVHRRLASRQRMAIAQAGSQVLRVFELSGVAATFRIFPTVEAAVAYVSETSAPGAAAATPPMTADAALSVGIATTAMPFARSDEDQVERWLRVLRHHGEAGVVLASLGVSEAPLRAPAAAEGPAAAHDADPVSAVSEYAGRLALQRRAPKVATTDVLLGVMREYGATFDRVLAAHGGDVDELAERLSMAYPAAA